jgi:hypothetical protein
MKKSLIFSIATISFSALAFLSISESHAQHTEITQRVKNQDAILGGLQASNNEVVSEFVRDWRKAYPEPTKENLSELRKIQQRIKKDKSTAIEMTQAYKIENLKVCRDAANAGTLSAVSECQPGL